jgi:hypothetical protein
MKDIHVYSFWSYIYNKGAVMVVIICYLDLQLPVQLVPITPKFVSSDIVHGSQPSTFDNWIS